MKHITLLVATGVLIFSVLATPIKSRIASAETNFNCESEPLPYGAIPIQFIESTGEQYINIGHSFISDTDEIRCSYEITGLNPSGWGSLFGANESGKSYNISYLGGNSPRCRFVYLNSSGNYSVQELMGGYHELVLSSLGIYNDGILVNDSKGNPLRGTWFCYLFANNLDGFTPFQFAYARVYSFVFIHNNEVVCNLIPVRVENEYGEEEGAMLNLVSGELFRNAGTSSFLLGPDL